MEWVTTTGKTVEEAKEAALDELGVDESEAEFEVLEEPKSSFFKLSRTDARVRARLLPKAPRPKQERRSRRRSGRRNGSDESTPKETVAAPAEQSEKAERAEDDDNGGERPSGSRRRRGRSRNRSGSGTGGGAATNQEGNAMTDDSVSVDQQADIITEFLEGLLGAISVEGAVERNKIDDSTIELGVNGESDLGLLIGPKGQTLTAVHELSRTVLQRRETGRHDGRVRIDIGGYRQRRAAALAQFVTQQAESVRSEGVARALEPMNAADRKIVHDTINAIDGLATLSEGTDPQRRVVIVPEDDAG